MTYDAAEHVKQVPRLGVEAFFGECPTCDYRSGQRTTREAAARSLAAHQRAMHPDNRTSEERVIDTAFEALIRQYTHSREWNVLELVNLLYGKVLTDREVSTQEAG